MTTLELSLFKINGSERKKYDIKVSAQDFKNRILFSNYVLDVMMKLKVSNYSISIKEFLRTSISSGFDQKFFLKNVLKTNSCVWISYWEKPRFVASPFCSRWGDQIKYWKILHY